jgi:hypothetical protein
LFAESVAVGEREAAADSLGADQRERGATRFAAVVSEAAPAPKGDMRPAEYLQKMQRVSIKRGVRWCETPWPRIGSSAALCRNVLEARRATCTAAIPNSDTRHGSMRRTHSAKALEKG